ncbi:hypothetical protein CANCADRAFT_16881, partial [Tortispora caseinolytica NRRL Y-17796]
DDSRDNSLADDMDLIESTDYVPPPKHVRGGVLSSLLELYKNEHRGMSSTTLNYMSSPGISSPNSVAPSAPGSGASTPPIMRPLSERRQIRNLHKDERRDSERFKKKKKFRRRITVHIAELLNRQQFIIKMCKALMQFGAPTHRLEEYLVKTARVLEVDAQFLYMPGCMIISFGDMSTHTSEMRLVRCAETLDLGKLLDAHGVYKHVVRDQISVDEASEKLDELLTSKDLYNQYICVLIYAIASAVVSPLFGAYWLDMPIAFILGLVVGTLRHIVAPRHSSYRHVFEVSSAIISSFLGRAFGTINSSDQRVPLFCFSSITQGSLALILPGYIILAGALELQTKNLVSGSVRMFYAIIYTMFLTFGITIGSIVFGWMDSNATSNTTCARSINVWYKFLFAPLFAVCLSIINQAKFRQLLIILPVTMGGYAVYFLFNYYFSNASMVASALSAFTIGLLGNLYNRVTRGLAIAVMLPAIFVIVPSGLASQGSLVYGVLVADSTRTRTLISAVPTSTSSTTASSSATSLLGSANGGMVEIAIAITVGLFVASLVVYPFGRKRGGLFT